MNFMRPVLLFIGCMAIFAVACGDGQRSASDQEQIIQLVKDYYAASMTDGAKEFDLLDRESQASCDKNKFINSISITGVELFKIKPREFDRIEDLTIVGNKAQARVFFEGTGYITSFSHFTKEDGRWRKSSPCVRS